MKHLLATFVALAAVLAGACGKDNAVAPSQTVTGVVVSGNATITTRLTTSQLTAIATLSNSSTQNVSTSALWSTSNASIASVSSTGLVTAVALGSATITASYQGSSGVLPVTVALKATPEITGAFKRLCGPFRARLDVTIAETSNNIGFNVNAMTLAMKDFYGVTQGTKSYSAAELTAAFGTNHFNVGQIRVLPSFEASYTGNVDTMDSTASVSATVTDDAGNTSTITVAPIPQRDAC